MIGVILAAGNGNRMSDAFGFDQCKALLKINDKYIIDYSLKNLYEINVSKIVIVVGKYLDVIKIAIGNEYKNIPIEYVIQDSAIGIINAFHNAVKNRNDNVVVQLCDEVFIDSKAFDIKKILEKPNFDFICGITHDLKDKIRYNYTVNFDSNGNIASFVEKPKRIKNDIKGTGFCYFNNRCISFLKEVYSADDNYPFDLCDYMNELVSGGYTGICKEVASKEININTVEDLDYAKKYILKRSCEE